jgi:D-aminopeptidase
MPRSRLRDLGITLGQLPAGPLNAITDVAGVAVGVSTIIRDEPRVARTGVTAIWPSPSVYSDLLPAGFHSFNGNGEMTGTIWLAEQGLIASPICITNTHAVGVVRDAIVELAAKRKIEMAWHLPVTAETWDGWLSDAERFPVTAADAIAALESAKGGAVPEGNVGGGTGMVCFGFKGGIGTASRVVPIAGARYTVGVLVQCNTGDRNALRIAGAPVGKEFGSRWTPCFDARLGKGDGHLKPCDVAQREAPPDKGSIIIVVGTDAPLMPLQLNRVAKRAAMGLARLGSYAGNSSGDLIVSFSTAPAEVNHEDQQRPSPLAPVANASIDPLFEATVQATEEAIVNALVAARTMTGVNGTRVFGIPHNELRAILKRYNRLEDKAK